MPITLKRIRTTTSIGGQTSARLEAESVRDSVLYVSGELELEASSPSPVASFDRSQLLNPGNRQLRAWEFDDQYRSVYVPVVRNLASRMFEAFDFPEPSETHGARDVTTGPQSSAVPDEQQVHPLERSDRGRTLMAAHSRDRDRAPPRVPPSPFQGPYRSRGRAGAETGPRYRAHT